MDLYFTTENTDRGFVFFIWAGARQIYRAEGVYESRRDAAKVARDIIEFVS